MRDDLVRVHLVDADGKHWYPVLTLEAIRKLSGDFQRILDEDKSTHLREQETQLKILAD